MENHHGSGLSMNTNSTLHFQRSQIATIVYSGGKAYFCVLISKLDREVEKTNHLWDLGPQPSLLQASVTIIYQLSSTLEYNNFQPSLQKSHCITTNTLLNVIYSSHLALISQQLLLILGVSQPREKTTNRQRAKHQTCTMKDSAFFRCPAIQPSL